MIEEVVLNYLTKELKTVPVLMELPQVPTTDYPVFPEKLVVMELIGRSVTDRVIDASIAFQSYGKSLYEAAALDEQVRAAMDDIGTLDGVSAHLASNYNHTDESTGRYRYQCVYEVYYV